MKKCFLYVGMFIMMVSMLSACGYRMTTYTYDNEAVLDIKIKKTEAYRDKLKIVFEDGSLSDVESVVCYGTDFSVIEEQPQFNFRGNTLTIETSNADRISGLHVVQNEELYFEVRYLDSDSYAMLVYSWACDAGYMTSGDENAYYTQEEKDEQEAKMLELAEAEETSFNKLLGIWKNGSDTVRIEFSYDEDSLSKKFTVNELTDNEWVEREVIFISAVTEVDSYESVEITLYDNPSWGCAYEFYLYNDNTRMECSYSDEKFLKTENGKDSKITR